jgi:hypothetical protein
VERDLEVRIGMCIDAVLDRIRSKVSLTGMAGKWHIGRASELLQSPELFELCVKPLSEHDEAKYLELLPGLIAETEEQDRRCAECWDTNMGVDQQNQYLAEREELIRLFLRFQFQPKVYERLVRQPEKPFLRDALRFLSAGRENTPEAIGLASILRMRLRDFVALEEGLVEDFRTLDEARDELCAAHKELALKVARLQPRSDESTLPSALVGLRRAAAYYDYKRGYSFEEYAEAWIQEAIHKRRG